MDTVEEDMVDMAVDTEEDMEEDTEDMEEDTEDMEDTVNLRIFGKN